MSVAEREDVVLVHLVAYDDQDAINVEEQDGEYVVTNHDDVPKTDVVRALRRESVEATGLDILTPESALWREEFADMELGDEVPLGGGEA